MAMRAMQNVPCSRRKEARDLDHWLRAEAEINRAAIT
jgi:hypothetical protein